MTNTKLIVAFCFDKNYAKYCQVAIFSLIVNHGNNIKLYFIFTEDVTQNDIDNMKLILIKFNIDFQFIKIPLINDVSYFKTNYHFTQANYIRLLLPDLLPKEDKILYLDCDLIINKPLTGLYDTNLDHYKYAGVLDKTALKTSKLDSIFLQNYVNSGVLLMNLKALREDGSLKKMAELYDQHISKIEWVDQCLINIYAHKNILVLDDGFNCQILSDCIDKDLWSKINGKKSVYHFVGGTKPWHRRSRKHVFDFWWSYANLIKSDQLQVVENFTINDMVIESKSLEEYGNYRASCVIKEGMLIAALKYIEINNLGDFRDQKI